MFKVNNKQVESRAGVFIDNFEDMFLVILLLTLNR